MPPINVMPLYKQFERTHGAIDDNWIAEAKNVTYFDIQATIKNLRYLNAIPNNKNADDLSAALTTSEQHFFKLFAIYATSSEKFLTDMLHSSQQEGNIFFQNPIGEGLVNCSISVCAGPIIFLRTIFNKEPLYIIQENFSAEAVYFPLRNTVLFFEGFLDPIGKLERLFLEIFRHGEEYAKYFTTNTRKWGGICYGHQSPFHFFYFQYPGLVTAFSEYQADAPNFYSFENQYFLDAPKAMGLNKSTTLLDKGEDLRQEIFSKQIFIFNLGLRTHVWRKNALKVRSMDIAIADYVQKNINLSAVTNNIKQDFDFVLWIGLTSGKRVWNEETETAIRFANTIAKQYKKVLLVVDGWTSVINQSAQNELYANDHNNALLIKNALPDNVQFISVVGSDPMVKIYYANHTDFFVSNHATGSLFVSRICGRPGVTHISNAARASAQSQHIHWNSEIIPTNLVNDIIETDKHDVFFVSYSINPDNFIAFATSALNKTKTIAQ